ncbi:hypothetical protein YC2023_014575 [Brassica napus]
MDIISFKIKGMTSSSHVSNGDFEKQEWPTHKYMVPPMWKNMVGELLRFVGYTNMTVLPHSSYVIYYNIKNNMRALSEIFATEENGQLCLNILSQLKKTKEGIIGNLCLKS